ERGRHEPRRHESRGRPTRADVADPSQTPAAGRRARAGARRPATLDSPKGTMTMTIVCARCGTQPTTHRQGIPWCEHCGIWLVRDEVTEQWVSFAERAHREPDHRHRQAVALTREAAIAAQPAVDALLPAGRPSHVR